MTLQSFVTPIVPLFLALAWGLNRFRSYLGAVWILPQVIKKLDPKQQPHVVPLEIQALKNQLQEKEKKITHLEASASSFCHLGDVAAFLLHHQGGRGSPWINCNTCILRGRSVSCNRKPLGVLGVRLNYL